MAQRKKLVHIHSNVYKNGAPQAPANGVLEKGEIAVNYNDTEPAMFIENNSGGIVKFNAIQRSEITQIQDDITGLGTCLSTSGGAKIKLNGTDKAISGNTIAFYAPTGSGATNTVLVSSGANQSPTWVQQSSLSVGSASQAGKTVGALTINSKGSFNGSADTTINLTYEDVGAAEATHTHTASDLPKATTGATGIMQVGDFLSVTTAGKVSVATGTTNATVSRGDHTHSYAGSSSAGGAANSTKGTLTINNNAGTAIAAFNGSASTAITLTPAVVGAAEANHTHTSAELPKATTGATGVMQVGSFLSVDNAGKVSVATGTSSTTVARGDHSHNYAGSASAGGAANSVKGSLTLNDGTGASALTYNGSASSSLTIDCAFVGAAEASHTHTSSDLPKATTGATGVMQVGSFLSVDANSKVSVATGTSSTTVARGDHSHNYAGSASAGGAANSTKGVLTINNNAGTAIAEFNGSTSTAITLTPAVVGAADANHTHTSAELPKATTGATGIMQVGSFLSVDANSKVSVATGTTNATVSRGDHTHKYAASDSAGGSANSTKGTLTIKNNAGTTIAAFNGSASTAITLTPAVVGAADASHTHTSAELPKATTASTGVVEIGDYLSVNSDGKISVITGTSATSVATGDHTHLYAGSASAGGAANSTKGKLTINNYSGGTLADFNGSTTTAITLTSAVVGAAEASHTHTSADLPKATTGATGVMQVGSFLSVDANSKVSVATGTTNATVSRGDHTHSYAGSASAGGAANSVKGTLTINNNAGTAIAAFNGSASTAITLTPAVVGAAEATHTHTSADLPKATTGATGVMQVGSFLSVDSNSKVSVATGTSSTTVARGDHSHSYAGSSSAGGAANSTKGTLTLKNSAGTTIAEFNGSTSTAITLNYSTVGAAQSTHTHTTSELPMDTNSSLSSSTDKIPSSSLVKAYVDGLVASPVNYKGAVTTGAVPTSSKVGDMYIVQTSAISLTSATSATGAAQTAEVGDYIICRSTGKWDVVQKNLTGAVTSSNNLTTDKFILGNANNQTVKTSTYGPTSFAEASHTHTSADLPKATTGATGIMQVGSFLSVDSNSKVSVATGTTNATVSRGDHTHNYAGSSSAGGAANSTKGTLTINNNAGTAIAAFNGSANTAITLTPAVVGAAEATHTHTSADLPKATTGATGVMQVGSFLSVDSNSKVSVATGTTNATVSRGDHTHSYAGSSSAGGAANSVKGTLTINNNAGTAIAAFNGSASTAITLTPAVVGAAESTHSHTGADIAKATTGATGVIKVGSFLSVDANGTLSVATGTSSTTVARGNHTHSYAGSASAGGAANSVKGKLTLKNNAGTTIAEFNGSADTSVTLTCATVGAAEATHSHTGSEITSAVANATNAVNADKVDGYHVSVVTTMPSSPDANTIYILK